MSYLFDRLHRYMTPHSERTPWVPKPLRVHPEDSMALAEHLDPQILLARLDRLTDPASPALQLEKAWACYDLAMATPGSAGDNFFFDLGRKCLVAILETPLSALPPRNKTRLNAGLLLDYTPAFVERAQHLFPSKTSQQNIRIKVGKRMERFLYSDGTDAELAPGDYGPLAETVWLYGALNGSHFPFITSSREEGNPYRPDNHDAYTLHPCARNTIKKVCTSIKHNSSPGLPEYVPLPEEPILHVQVGKIALWAANLVDYPSSPYRPRDVHWATRTTADIAVCHALGEALETPDRRFLDTFTAEVDRIITDYADNYTGPDYTRNHDRLTDYLIGPAKPGIYYWDA